MKHKSRNRICGRGFTLVETLIAVGIIGITISGSLLTIQASRLHSRNVSLEMVAQNMAASLMEMVKRSGYNEVAYGSDLPDLLQTNTTSAILNFPAGETPPEQPKLPAGAAGGATDPTAYDNPSALSNANFLKMSADQIAALNGYQNDAAVPDGVNLLDPKLEWGVYIEEQSDVTIVYPVKLVVIVVKWKSNWGERDRLVTLRTLISDRTSRI